MRGKILKREHVAGRERDDALGIACAGKFAEAAKDGNEVLDCAVVVDDEDEGTVGISPQKHEQQGFRRGRKSGHTNAPRALPQVGGNTREGGKRFYVREEFADEGKQHADLILAGTEARVSGGREPVETKIGGPDLDLPFALSQPAQYAF